MRVRLISCAVHLCAWAGLPLVMANPDFAWSAVTPSTQLQHHPCFDGFQCARLSVPLDWLDEGNNKTAALAVITLPATVPADDPSFGGTIITNPGGPGGSGVNFLQRNGRLLQLITEGKKHYEILSFDPRGVNNTTPRADCFGSSHLLARDSFVLGMAGIGGLDTSDSGLSRALALFDGYGSICEMKDEDEDGLAYVSTASVARDVVEIADRVEELRQAGRSGPWDQDSQRPIGFRGDKEKRPVRVQYWGFSYGTVLGNTLASMFPGRMGRVILDGVVDIHDYMEGRWLRNLLDTEKIIDYFYDSCFEATDGCPLWQPEDKSSADITTRIDRLISQADAEPVAIVPNDGTLNIRIVTGNDIRNTFTTPLYKPLPALFDRLALALAEALKGNYSLIGGEDPPRLQDACGANVTVDGDAQTAISCGDARYTYSDKPHGHGLSYWKDYLGKLKEESSTVGAYWSSIAVRCSGWRITPKWGFKGPWTTPPADPSLEEDAPAAPILFTSSRLDPVTPLVNAYAMSNHHPGSSVLSTNGVGHCAMGNGWSECFNAAIRAYLDDGIVPKNGTVCADTTCKPFSEGGKCEPPRELLSAGLLEGLVNLPDWPHTPPLGIPL